MRGIVVAAFGTSYEDTLEKCIVPFVDMAKKEEENVKLAFTSRIIKSIWAKRGVNYFNEMEAVSELKDSGVEDIRIFPLHIIRGYEYEKLEVLAKEENLKLGEPLLETSEDIVNFVDKIEFADKNETVILMGHGTTHMADWVYEAIEEEYRARGYDIYVGTVEGERSLDHILPDLIKRGIKKVILEPFMLVAGDHAKNDMAGDDDSWKSQLEAREIEVDARLIGLGELEVVRELYLNKLHLLLDKR
ncbi:MAG: sirohydrochlorin cobaltochelatase [Ezakiella sp.]|nr:sirohydrochlorin cobaltochelatase [Bacillota bacterium]MDY3946484.1 sirohydrochlorin cobaltochelatase [Ezakiella sp.]